MKIVSINMIIDLNNILKEKILNYKIHLRDCCGSSSMWIEPLEPKLEPVLVNELFLEIDKYFQTQGIKLQYSDDKISFWEQRN